MLNLYILRMKMACKSSIPVLPTVAVIAFLGCMYMVVPEQISGSFLLSGVMMFFVGAYISMIIQAKENDVHEQIMLLHSKSSAAYYISRELVIYTFALVYSLAMILYPTIKYQINNSLFTRPLEANDVVFGGLIVLGSAFCGTAVGDLFHHRIIVTRRNCLAGLLLVLVLSACKQAIIHSFGFLKVLNILLPPTMDGFVMVGNSDIFDTAGTMKIFAHMVVYVVVVTVLKIKMLDYKKM